MVGPNLAAFVPLKLLMMPSFQRSTWRPNAAHGAIHCEESSPGGGGGEWEWVKESIQTFRCFLFFFWTSSRLDTTHLMNFKSNNLLFHWYHWKWWVAISPSSSLKGRRYDAKQRVIKISKAVELFSSHPYWCGDTGGQFNWMCVKYATIYWLNDETWLNMIKTTLQSLELHQ